MAQTKAEKQQKALDKLVASIGDDMGRMIPSKRQEYNALKRKLGQSGRII